MSTTDHLQHHRALRVFLCHSSSDKPSVRELYQGLVNDGVEPWLDEESLLPGQYWQQEIPKAVRGSDVVLVCLSSRSINKAGYLQKEIKLALDAADEQPEGTIFVVPVKLEECNIPDRLNHLHWVNLFQERGYERLLSSLHERANNIANVKVPRVAMSGTLPEKSNFSTDTSLSRTHSSQEELPPLAPTTPTKPVLLEQAMAAIKDTSPHVESFTRRYMQRLERELNTLNPDFSIEGEMDEMLVQALQRTKHLIIEFAQLAQAVAIMNSMDAALTIYKSFSFLLNRYNLPRGFSGSYKKIDYDFYKFIGHEIFVTLFSFLIKENRWTLIGDLFDEDICIENTPEGTAGVVAFDCISQYVELLDYRNNRLLLRRVSVHADLLNERHTQGDLGDLVPMRQFMEADYFLFLRGELVKEISDAWIAWKAWSTLYIASQAPRFLAEAIPAKSAQQLLRPLGVKDIHTLRERLAERASKQARLFNDAFWIGPLACFDLSSVGSR